MSASTTPAVSNRIPTLDGWRGLAIALVLFDHIQDSLLGRYIEPWTRTGIHGVTIFFVLSGFLITSKLLEGPIQLKQFYLRRFFRLIPAAWLFLAAMVFLTWWTHVEFVSKRELLSCLLFYRSFVDFHTGFAGHFWSLSIEEQFYFVWPCVLLFSGKRRGLWIASGAIGIFAFYRLSAWSYYVQGTNYIRTPMHVDALLVGCLLALLYSDERWRANAKRYSAWLAAPALVVLAVCVARFHILMPLTECMAIALLILASMQHSHEVMARPLSFRPLAWLGTISYSIYLWQEPLMGAHNGYVLAIGLPILSLGSYYLVERPAVRLGHRLTQGIKPTSQIIDCDNLLAAERGQRIIS